MVAEEAIENGLLSEAATKTQDAIKKYLNLYRIKYNSHEYHSKIRHDSSV